MDASVSRGATSVGLELAQDVVTAREGTMKRTCAVEELGSVRCTPRRKLLCHILQSSLKLLAAFTESSSTESDLDGRRVTSCWALVLHEYVILALLIRSVLTRLRHACVCQGQDLVPLF